MSIGGSFVCRQIFNFQECLKLFKLEYWSIGNYKYLTDYFLPITSRPSAFYP